jgi:hypothetical protein
MTLFNGMISTTTSVCVSMSSGLAIIVLRFLPLTNADQM